MIAGFALGIGNLYRLFFYTPIEIPDFFVILLILIFVFAIGGYLLIPTHIYQSFSPLKYYSKEFILYYAFTIFTFGIGPSVMYFIKWKTIIKSKMKIEGGPGL
jgi:hypothetical protein